MSRSSAAPKSYPPEDLLNWTPRQREVLELLARGRSNAEIAEALGISLEGAKYHVREIMSKLDVESREEAADYWRQRNGLPARLRRVWRGALGVVPAKWVAAAGTAVVGVGVAGVALAVALGGNASAPDTAEFDASVANPETPTAESPAFATDEIEVITDVDEIRALLLERLRIEIELVEIGPRYGGLVQGVPEFENAAAVYGVRIVGKPDAGIMRPVEEVMGRDLWMVISAEPYTGAASPGDDLEPVTPEPFVWSYTVFFIDAVTGELLFMTATGGPAGTRPVTVP